MPLALLGLAAALALNVLLGPLGLGSIEWRVSANGLNQTYGADAAMLVLVTPTAIAAAWLWRKGHRLAAPLTLGVGLASLYYAIAETLGGDYLRYPGNNERFFLLFLVIIVLSWRVAVGAWAALDPDPPRPSRHLAQALALVFIAGGVLMGGAWLKQLIDIAATDTLGPEFTDSPSAFFTIRIVDLGFIVPVLLWTGSGLLRVRAGAIKAAYGVASFMLLQASAVLAMGFVMIWRNDPTASPELVYALTPITIALGVLTALLLRSYVRGGVTAELGTTSTLAVRRSGNPPTTAPTSI